MATKAELQKAVDDTTAAATSARADWKAAIPGEDAPKMSAEEQAEVDALEAVYVTAKDARKAAETALANWAPPAPVAAAGSSNTGNRRKEELETEWLGGYF